MIHMASFPLFFFATIHAVTAGTDTGSRLFEVTALLAITLVCGLTVARVLKEKQPARPAGTAISRGRSNVRPWATRVPRPER